MNKILRPPAEAKDKLLAERKKTIPSEETLNAARAPGSTQASKQSDQQQRLAYAAMRSAYCGDTSETHEATCSNAELRSSYEQLLSPDNDAPDQVL
eukprot:4098941-Prymnesium_polylepis.1